MNAREALLDWYDRSRRELPWRVDRDPYRVWVSEIMLQQTRVDAVVPFYERFLERFPDVELLAAAEIEEVLVLWSGLGYYRRARQLHAAARRIAELGSFPASLDGLRELPGVGEYTAAAVGSIAFGLAEPVLDGNVERVLARRLALAGDPKARAVREELRRAARELLDPERPGDSNQAMMELGATVCRPGRPACLLCPIPEGCEGRRQGSPESFPRPRKSRRPVRVSRLAAVVEQDGRALLFRRPDDAELLAGTWELPWVDLANGAAAGAAEAGLAERYGGSWRLGDRLGLVKHGITFRSLEVAVHRAELSAEGALAAGREAGWFDAAERRELPLSSLVGKVLAALG